MSKALDRINGWVSYFDGLSGKFFREHDRIYGADYPFSISELTRDAYVVNAEVVFKIMSKGLDLLVARPLGKLESVFAPRID